MKTNQFENTIRRKLESIQPDFQEQDWAKMQQYMQVHTPPTLWQQYGSWIGYAAAASVTTVMAFLYVNQLSQNDHLVTDVKNLKSQIEVIQQQPVLAAKTDTIYLVQKEPVVENHYIIPERQQQSEELADNVGQRGNEQLGNVNLADSDKPLIVSPEIENIAKPNAELALRTDVEPDLKTNISTSYPGKSDSNVEKNGVEPTSPVIENVEIVSDVQSKAFENESAIAGNQGNLSGGQFQKALNSEFADMNVKSGTSLNNGHSISRQMQYELASRLSAKQVQKALSQVNTQVINNALTANTQITKATASDKKIEKTNKAENVIPKLNLKVPYRFGGGIAIEGNGQAKTIVGEVLIAKKFSITAGISWLKLKPMEFFTEKIFREKNRKDFKRTHPNEVPLAFDVYNIRVNPTLVQIPLTVAFRNNIKDNWAYYAGVGTNITIASREKVSFDCRAPNNQYFNQVFDKKTDNPAINSINFSMGLEKTWHPIVVQAEGYLYTYFTPLTPLSHNAGPGVKLKLLYQIGGKM
ncbi:hypothetical protein [Dyadobacter arcticus]|uniref:Outer membrane protein beta-barrel domain-containing protein n=1 Tax=Dyadobacter arcticus TaxID=1078754 RepID=A0ABX0ULQ3_9BACT|nr:hypothetical protein [Dyadobacter arcticus]NIJ53383.1 hypothetical protein [Dyadobacter arcticus]